MALPTFDEFRAAALADGFDEVLERTWAPDEVVDAHRHPFTAAALVVQGTMWLTCGDDTRRLDAGDTFRLDARSLHSERYGPAGATYWVARRDVPEAVDHA